MKLCLVCEGMTDVDRDLCTSCTQRLVRTDAVHFPLRRGEEDAGHPLLGTLVDGKYRLTNVLGKGGMGTVFRAVHQVSLVPVALKVLHPRFAVRPEYRSHFLHEARKAGRVVHEHSARIQDVGEAKDGTVYIAMELVEGVTLHEWIHGDPALSTATIVEILRQITRALAAAHAQGLVHRDLTPRNVMVLVREGRPFVKILDFGIARVSAPLPDEVETTGSGLAGFANPPYSAPEHLEAGAVDARTDLYSLGVIAYEMLTRKLPVRGRTRQELAQETLAGRLLPLKAHGAPSALLRLVRHLLQRSPSARPTSAAAVLAVFDSILEPPSQTLRVVSVSLMFLAVAVVGLVYRQRPQVYLSPDPAVPGARLELTAADGGLLEVQELRSEDLRRLQFLYGGFDGRRIQVEAASQGGVWELVSTLSPRVDGQKGSLVVDRTDPGHVTLLQSLAGLSQHGPVTLRFRADGRLLGFGRVRIDDTPPRLLLAAEGVVEGVLSGNGELVLDCVDEGTIEAWFLELNLPEQGGAVRQEEIRLVPRQGGRREPARVLLEPWFSRARPEGPVTVRMVARDRAGNVAIAGPLTFTKVDLRTPLIRAVGGVGRTATVRYGAGVARLLVEIDQSEPELTVLVRIPGQVEWTELTPMDGGGANVLELSLPGSDEQEGPFLDGSYEFRLRDAAGNVSPEPYRVVLRFQSEALHGGLEVVESEGHPNAVFDGAVLFTAGEPVQLKFACNEIYQPVSTWWLPSAVGASPMPGLRLTMSDVGPGRARIDLPSVPDGSAELRITIAEPGGSASRVLRYRVLTQKAPVRLELPDTTNVRYLRQLMELDVLQTEAEHLRTGPAWRLEPAEPQLIRGLVWSGARDAMVGSELEGATASGLPLRSGWNLLCVEAYDPLSRLVEVRVGGTTASRLDGQRSIIARYFHHEGAAVPEDPELRIEYAQDLRLVLRVPVPVGVGTEAREIGLFIDTDRISPDRVEVMDEWSLLWFTLPFARVATAAQIAHLTAHQFAETTEAVEIRARLRTPARDYDLVLPGRTSRSNLTEIRIGELSRGRELPPVLAGIEMVPVLGPGPDLGFADPVPLNILDRRSFRPQPALTVRNLTPVYLQRGEFTRAQYHAMLQLVEENRSLLRANISRLVHSADPRAAARLEPEALLPAWLAGDREAFERQVAAGGQRSVSGVDFFQAYTMTRLCGLFLLGDPDALRLPLGVEMECAALHGESARVALNGASRLRDRVRTELFHRAASEQLDPSRWPPTLTESVAMGDVVDNDPMWVPIVGLDFGVREWVFDLPFVAAEAERTVLSEWQRDHGRHLEQAEAFARGESGGELSRLLAQTGVVRGLSLAESDGLMDVLARRGTRVEGLVTAGVPGVVRTLYLRRDGRGLLPEEWDPVLALTGFRLAGGRAFVAGVRGR